MAKKSTVLLSLLFLTLSLNLVLADYSIDVSGLNSEEYKLGEEINFQVVLLDGEEFVEEQVTLEIMDALAKKLIIKTVTSNSASSITIGDDFPGGLWRIVATIGETTVERSFSISTNVDVEFAIEGDELIIRNKGNIRYTKTVQITIGDETNSYAQNIGVGDEKILKLISAEGTYDIFVTDGEKELRKESIQLYGTGNVVGAVDRELVGYTGFAGTADPTEEGTFISTKKLPLALTFIVGVMILGALVFFERKMTRKAKAK